MPNYDDSYTRTNLLPFVASEILCYDVGNCLEKFFLKKNEEIISTSEESHELIQRSFQVLNEEGPLNPVLSGYFYKLLNKCF